MIYYVLSFSQLTYSLENLLSHTAGIPIRLKKYLHGLGLLMLPIFGLESANAFDPVIVNTRLASATKRYGKGISFCVNAASSQRVVVVRGR